jgi:hypothetical protein
MCMLKLSISIDIVMLLRFGRVTIISGKTLFHQRKCFYAYVMSSPIHDLKDMLSSLNVQFLDKSLSYSCQRTRTCHSPLRILTRNNGMSTFESIADEFYRFYRDQVEMNLVDAFVCFHPASMCELYMPFDRSIIIIASTRYELGRFNASQWFTWNVNLKKIANNPKNLIAANNLYDAQYIRYFTGIDVTVLPSYCHYTHSEYQPTRHEFLLAPIHAKSFELIFMRSLEQSLHQYREMNIQIVPIRKIYINYEYIDLAHHPAIIHVPYQVSFMSLFEQYRMNIPLFFPSLNLLTRWQYDHQVVSERTWDQTLYGIRPQRSTINGVLIDVPDPNNDFDLNAIRYWLNLSDFYQWPHIVYYESTNDLIEKLLNTDLLMISKQMKQYNKQVAIDLHKKWTKILSNIKQHSKKFQHDIVS